MNETSITLSLHPDLVHMEALPSDMAEWPKAIAGLDPRIYASPELGQKILQAQGERMEAMLREALSFIYAVGNLSVALFVFSLTRDLAGPAYLSSGE